MADYQDLLDAIARVRSATGDPAAWQTGLSGADIAVASTPISSPEAIADVMAKLIAAHRDVFAGRPAPAAPPPAVNQGAAADAIRQAQTALGQQYSAAARTDLQVVSAVLNAHATQAAGQAQLERVQSDIETAVLSRTALDTPAGAREFQRFLIGELRDIQGVLDSASLDANSQAAVAAALASLYASSTPPKEQSDSAPAQRDSAPQEEERSKASALPHSPADDLPDLPADLGPLPDEASLWPAPAEPAATPPAAPPAAVPVAAAAPAPATPAAWGGMPGAMPLGAGGFPPLSGTDFGGGLSPGSGFEPRLDSGFDPADLRRHHQSDGLDGATDLTTDELPDDAAEPNLEPADQPETTVELPDGDTVYAASPQVAAAVSAAVAGTPIPDAFRQQGIVLQPPGSPVTAALMPADVVCGDIGVLADRNALALGHGKALLDGQIQPISAVTGPGFLGWQHPPRPEPTTTSPEVPAPNRPAQTAPS